MRCLVAVSVIVAVSMVSAREFHVATSGADGNSGTSEKPFATLTKARDAARRSEGSDVVIVHRGVYRLTEPLKFGPADSGVVFQAAAGETPVISGGRRVTGWKKVGGNHYVASVPWVTVRDKGFRRLSVNGVRRQRARYPNEGFLKAGKDGLPATARYNEHRPNLYYVSGDWDSSWTDLGNAEIVMHHFWNDSHLRIRSVEAKDNLVRLVTPCGKSFATGWSNNEVGDNPGLYVIENFPEALDEPGEWYLDYAARQVHYLAQKGEDPNRDQVTVPVVSRLVEIVADPARDGLWVERVVFDGIEFREAQYELPEWNVNNAQGSCETGAAIVLEGARRCRFTRCAFTDLSAYAILFGAGARENAIDRSRIFATGGGGVRLGGGEWKDHPFRQTRGNIIADCEIVGWGDDFKSSCGVMGLHAAETKVVHNHLHDGYYIGIAFGWHWGYDESVSWGNEIGWNHVHDIGKGNLLSDMGGIYTVGVQPGTRIHHNLIHDIKARCYGGWGIYQDEGATHTVVEYNIVHHTQHAGYNIHFGKEILVRNNVFAYGRYNQLQRQRREPHKSLYFYNNIVLWDSGGFMTGDWDDNPKSTYKFYRLFFQPQYVEWWSTFEMDRNVYWNPELPQEGVRFGGAAKPGICWADWQALGKDVHSVYADPGFVGAEKGDFRFKGVSPAFALGFESFDLSAVGPRTSKD